MSDDLIQQAMDDIVKQARDHAAVLSQLAHPLSEGMSDAKRIDAFVSIGNEAAALLVSLADEVVRLREALAAMVYETTHLSPMEVNGDHRCRISAAALTRARAALMAHTRENAE